MNATSESSAIVYATTAEGLRLPVIDVTHPAFAVPDDPASAAARREALRAWERRNNRVPGFVTRLLMRLAARRSPLLRKIMGSGDHYLDSITTYIFKLGPEHLPPGFDSRVDRKIVGSQVMMVRLRMQQIAGLLADALRGPLAAAPDAPLHFVNIAGGPAFDSLNALIMLVQAGAALNRRPIAIHVFDARREGPDFGARALVALTASGAPLHGLDVQFQHRAYDWNDTAPLAGLLAGLSARSAITAASSEGGLFEYGDDGAIVANLTALARGSVPIVAGSVTSATGMRKRMIAQTRFRLFPRGLEGFAPLAVRGGYTIAASRDTVISEQVLLRLRGPG